MDRGTWWVIGHGVAKSQTQVKQLITHACRHAVHVAMVGSSCLLRIRHLSYFLFNSPESIMKY